MTLFGPKTFAPKNLCKRPRPSRPAQDTRRDTLASFYQTLFDYQMSLLDLELATATPLPK